MQDPSQGQPLFSKQDFQKQEKITQDLHKALATAIQDYMTHDKENVNNKEVIIRSHMATEILVSCLATVLSATISSFIEDPVARQQKVVEAVTGISADLKDKIKQDLLILEEGTGPTQ